MSSDPISSLSIPFRIPGPEFERIIEYINRLSIPFRIPDIYEVGNEVYSCEELSIPFRIPALIT